MFKPISENEAKGKVKEMIDVMGVANQNNKLVEAYGVEVDDFLK